MKQLTKIRRRIYSMSNLQCFSKQTSRRAPRVGPSELGPLGWAPARQDMAGARVRGCMLTTRGWETVQDMAGAFAVLFGCALALHEASLSSQPAASPAIALSPVSPTEVSASEQETSARKVRLWRTRPREVDFIGAR